MLDIRTQTQLINNPLSYRPKLTIPKTTNFGLEIEMINVSLIDTYNIVKEQFGSGFRVDDDRSLKFANNAEISTPVMKNTVKDWLVLKKISELINKLNPTFDGCSLQINFDGSLLPTDDDKINLLKLFAFYEDIIYRFSKGEDKSYRSTISVYAEPIILVLKDAIRYENSHAISWFQNQKCYGINFKTAKDVIEFRSPNGTKNINLWQNYVTFFYYLIQLVRTKKYNQIDVDSYIDSYSQINILKDYEQLKEDKALKLSKTIFKNQNDRVYFLEQYIGHNK